MPTFAVFQLHRGIKTKQRIDYFLNNYWYFFFFFYYSDTLEIRSSPVPGLAPAQPTTKMFDFTVLSTESPQANSCLLSLTGCRDCTVGNHQSDDEVKTRSFKK